MDVFEGSDAVFVAADVVSLDGPFFASGFEFAEYLIHAGEELVFCREAGKFFVELLFEFLIEYVIEELLDGFEVVLGEGHAGI